MILLEPCLQIIAAILAVLGLAILFQAPTKQWLSCCIVGGIGWFVNLVMMHFGLPAVLATVAATIVITLLARLLSVLRAVPVSVFLLTGIFPLVPGVKIYLAASYAFSKNMSLFGESGMDALMQSGAIVMGILLASSLPQGFFTRFAKKQKPAKTAEATEASETDDMAGHANT